MTKKVKKKKESLVLQISNRLRKEILEGVYKPKEKLIEEDMTKRFNISRSPVRESFRVLEAENLINIIPGKGAFVTNIEEKDIDRIYELRIVLEGLAAKLACRNITDEELLIFTNPTIYIASKVFLDDTEGEELVKFRSTDEIRANGAVQIRYRMNNEQ